MRYYVKVSQPLPANGNIWDSTWYAEWHKTYLTQPFCSYTSSDEWLLLHPVYDCTQRHFRLTAGSIKYIYSTWPMRKHSESIGDVKQTINNDGNRWSFAGITSLQITHDKFKRRDMTRHDATRHDTTRQFSIFIRTLTLVIVRRTGSPEVLSQ